MSFYATLAAQLIMLLAALGIVFTQFPRGRERRVWVVSFVGIWALLQWLGWGFGLYRGIW